MAFFSGTIYDEDGKVCCENVRLSLDLTERGEGTSWHGTVSAGTGIEMLAGKKYRLVLADGRAGAFVVRRNTAASPEERAIAIWGVGPLE